MRFRKGLLALALSAAAGSARAQSRVPEPGATEVTLYARLLAMTDARTLDTALVSTALRTDWTPLRRSAALAIGQVGSRPGAMGAPLLRALLADRDSGVAANAAYAIGLLRDSASVTALAAALDSPEIPPDVRREAAWALGEIGAPARAAIEGALGGFTVRSAADAPTRIQTLLAAAKLRPIPIDGIRPFLGDDEPSVVWAAAYSIARSHASSGARDLIRLDSTLAAHVASFDGESGRFSAEPYLDDASAAGRTRAEIARGLSRSAAGDSLRDAALSVLARLAADPDPHVRINALRSLGTYGIHAREAIVGAAGDSDPNVRIAAAQGLAGALRSDDPDWSALWRADTALAYRSALLAAATQSGLRPPELALWTSARDWRQRAAVAAASGDSSSRAFDLARALPLTRDRDARVREIAYSAISPRDSAALESSAYGALRRGLSDRDAYVRAAVLSILADRPAVADVPEVLRSYRLARADSINDARLGAVRYLASLWNKDSASVSRELRARLSALPVPADPLERDAGSGASIFASWAHAPSRQTLKPLSWYEGVLRAIVLPAYRGNPAHATLHTIRGDMRLELFGLDAPVTVDNFLTLARSGFYRNTRFMRVVPNFVIQDGDPRGDGNGGPPYTIRDEMNRRRYERGALGMALSGPDTGGSQYFITHSPQPHLDGHYTVFGRLIAGFDVLDRIVQGDLITSVDAK